MRTRRNQHHHHQRGCCPPLLKQSPAVTSASTPLGLRPAQTANILYYSPSVFNRCGYQAPLGALGVMNNDVILDRSASLGNAAFHLHATASRLNAAHVSWNNSAFLRGSCSRRAAGHKKGNQKKKRKKDELLQEVQRGYSNNTTWQSRKKNSASR